MQRHRYNLYKKAAELGTSKAHMALGNIYHVGGDQKKAKFHYESADMAGHKIARFNLEDWRLCLV